MKKYEMFRSHLVSMGIIGTIGVLLSTAVLADPPPPPPPPIAQTLDAADKLMNSAKRVKTDYVSFQSALTTFLAARESQVALESSPTKTSQLEAQNLANTVSENKVQLGAAAEKLVISIKAIQSMAARLEAEVNKSTPNDQGAVVSAMTTQVSKSKLPPKDKEDLMNELRKVLSGRQSAMEFAPPLSGMAPAAPTVPAKPAPAK